MTRSELIERLIYRARVKHSSLDKSRSVDFALPQTFENRDCDLCVRALLDFMVLSLAEGKRIEIRGFGSFAVNIRPARVGRNPKTGASVLVPEKRVPHFKCGKDLKLQLKQDQSHNFLVHPKTSCGGNFLHNLILAEDR